MFQGNAEECKRMGIPKDLLGRSIGTIERVGPLPPSAFIWLTFGVVHARRWSLV